PDDQERVRETFQSSVSQRKKWEFECRIFRPNGDIRWIWACGDQNLDSSGIATRMFGIVQDITERKQAEERLRKSEENYRMLWDSMDEAFCSIEMLFDQDDKPVDYRFLEVNPAFAKQTGMDNAQGRRIRELQPQQEEYWYQIFGQVARTGRAVRFENEAAQLHRWYEVHAFRVGDPRENKVAILFSDITERRQAEEALRESEERFRTLIEQASDAFFLHDSDGRFLEVNRQACESLGYTREELLRLRVFDVEQELDIGNAQQAGEQAEPGKAYTLQGRQRRKDGTAFPVEVRLSAYYIDGQKLHLGLARDITERERTQEALREQAQIMDSAQVFVRDMQSRVIYWPKGAEKLYGFTRKEAVGVLSHDLFDTKFPEPLEMVE